MTEKEYLENLGADFGSTTDMWKLKALSMAKAQGAKFDSELIELPRLTTRPHAYGAVVELAEPRETPRSRIYTLTQAQADEVIRRCDLVNRIGKYLKGVPLTTIAEDIINMIDEKAEE